MDPNSTPRSRGARFVADDAVKGEREGDNRYPKDQLPDPYAPDPYADEARWPAWKVSVFVILFSGLCWAGIAFIASSLFG